MLSWVGKWGARPVTGRWRRTGAGLATRVHSEGGRSGHGVGEAGGEEVEVEEESLCVDFLLLLDRRVVEDVGDEAAVHVRFGKTGARYACNTWKIKDS